MSATFSHTMTQIYNTVDVLAYYFGDAHYGGNSNVNVRRSLFPKR